MQCSIVALEGDMRWITSDVRRQTEMLWLWNRLIHMDESRLTKRYLYMTIIYVKKTGVMK